MAWVETAKESKRKQGVARRVILRLLNQRASACFDRWVDAVSSARQVCAAAAQRASEEAARLLLIEQCKKGIAQHLIRVYMIRRRRQVVQRAVESWKRAASRTREGAAVCRRVLSRLLVRSVWAAFECWRKHGTEQKRQRAVILRAAARLRNRWVVVCFEAWQHRAAAVRHCSGIVAVCIKRVE